MEIVYTLYRVLTKQQVDKVKDDIPMLKEACHEFAERMGWTIGKEFLEKRCRASRFRQVTMTLYRIITIG